MIPWTYSDAKKSEIERMEAEIRRLARRGGDSDDEPVAKKQKKSYLDEEMAKYSQRRGVQKKGKDGRRKDEGDVLATLNSFRSKLQSTKLDEAPEDAEAVEEPQIPNPDDPGMEVDDDRGFLSHALRFPKGNEEEVAKAERDYEVIDPRQRGARARDEERERKRAAKAKDGGRGSRR